MNERTPAQIEDPLPIQDPLTFDEEVYLFHEQNPLVPNSPHKLSELVSFDPRDPFVWLATQSGPPKIEVRQVNPQTGMLETNMLTPGYTDAFRTVMWAAYRMSGTLPNGDFTPKLRDGETVGDSQDESLFNDLKVWEKKILADYVLHLRSFPTVYEQESIPLVRSINEHIQHLDPKARAVAEQALVGILENNAERSVPVAQ